ncbi:MAG: rhomboid family intramembrane serine protease [Propionibacteriales bacterium]|nr:rhomboid family intramembrane serine protease [Propionibacteriales bacterium]
MAQGGSGGRSQAVPTCYQHPNRETYIRCQRCDRPICPDCMREASVGYQCPVCVAEGQATVRQPRTVYGGALGPGRPVVTYGLIAINTALMILVWVTGGSMSGIYLDSLQYSGEPLTNQIDPAGGVGDGEYWRLITSAFMHDPGMPFHILMNMFALYIFGPALEARMGWWRFLSVYLLAALSGSLFVYWLSPNPTVGASGAVFGLLGAALVITVRRGQDASWLIGLLLINVVISVGAPNISWQGHLGGFVGGALLALLLEHAPRRHRTLVQVVGFVVVLAVLVVLVAVRTSQIDIGR